MLKSTVSGEALEKPYLAAKTAHYYAVGTTPFPKKAGR
jgi:hypothetical protein